MSDWIELAYEQRQQSRKEHEHYWAMFPTLAERMWSHIQALIKEDVAKLQVRFPEFSSLQVVTTHPYRDRLKISYMMNPAYSASLVFDVKGQQITVEQERKLNEDDEVIPAKTSFSLSLDKAHRTVFIKLHGKLVTPEYVSEYCLRPLLED